MEKPRGLAGLVGLISCPPTETSTHYIVKTIENQGKNKFFTIYFNRPIPTHRVFCYKNMLILLGDCLTLWLMFYGLVFSGEDKLSVRNQRAGIIVFATKHNWPIDKFIVLDKNFDFSEIKPGDTVICYAWNCLCHRWALLQKFIMFALEHGIYVYSVTSNYCIDETMDMKTLKYAFGMYQDMRFNFISGKNTAGARQRVLNGHAPGRPHGARNIRHVIDGKEDIALKMYKNGASMYAIAKKIGVSGPTVKRFLASQG